MEPSEIETGTTRVPQACTLSDAARARRVSEFDGLFREAVRGIDRVDPARLRLELEASPQVAARAAGLMTAETACCSFFTFTLTAAAASLVLDVTVPQPHTGVLDALAGHARIAAGDR